MENTQINASGHPQSNQGPSDSCNSLQSDALPTELQPVWDTNGTGRSTCTTAANSIQMPWHPAKVTMTSCLPHWYRQEPPLLLPAPPPHPSFPASSNRPKTRQSIAHTKTQTRWTRADINKANKNTSNEQVTMNKHSPITFNKNCTLANTHRHTCTHTRMCTYARTRTHTHAQTYVYTRTHALMYICAHTHTHTNDNKKTMLCVVSCKFVFIAVQ